MRNKVRGVIVLAAFAVANVRAADYYVAQNGQTSAVPYTSWATAASNIQYAVNAAPSGSSSDQHTVWVGPGRYTAPTNAKSYIDANTNVVLINDRAIILRSSSADPALTIIDGGGKYRGIYAYFNHETTNHIVIDGFTISNCVVTNYGGGGVLMNGNNHGWTGMVRNCVFTNNKAVGTSSPDGGGLFARWLGGSSDAKAFVLTVSDCVFRNNRADGFGGGLHSSIIGNAGRRMRVVRCLIENNQATSGGGLSSSFADLENCEVRNNSAVQQGGGVYNANRYVSLKNTLLCNNVAYQGSAVYYKNETERTGDELVLDNCTIVSNSAGLNGAIRLYNNANIGQVSIRNSIVYSNALDVDFYNVPDMTNITLTTSCTSNTNGFPGSGNTTNNPAFKNFARQDFRLKAGSPCLNVGTYGAWMDGAVDLDGEPRIDKTFGVVDMGCYEYRYRGTMMLIR